MYRKRWQGWLRIGRVVVLSVVSVLFSWHIPGAQEREEAPTESEVSEKKAAIPQLETIVVTRHPWRDTTCQCSGCHRSG